MRKTVINLAEFKKVEFHACNSLHLHQHHCDHHNCHHHINIIRNATKKAELEACATLADNFKSGLIKGGFSWKKTLQSCEHFLAQARDGRGEKARKSTDPKNRKVRKLLLRYLYCIMMFL